MRLKIIQAHFGGSSIYMQPFTEMDLISCLFPFLGWPKIIAAIVDHCCFNLFEHINVYARPGYTTPIPQWGRLCKNHCGGKRLMMQR